MEGYSLDKTAKKDQIYKQDSDYLYNGFVVPDKDPNESQLALKELRKMIRKKEGPFRQLAYKFNSLETNQ